MDNKYWKIKFFGSMNRNEQVKMIKTVIAAHKYGYQVINGLKIREYV